MRRDAAVLAIRPITSDTLMACSSACDHYLNYLEYCSNTVEHLLQLSSHTLDYQVQDGLQPVKTV